MEIFDLILFAGQSNMAGRGIVTEKWKEKAPKLVGGAGYEYRAISDQQVLHVIEEPFGVEENNPNGIYEPGMKTGSMVTAFVNAYYGKTGMPILAVSASKGGSAIAQWQGNNDFLSDAIARWKAAEVYAWNHQIRIRHRFVAWCQGETDGDLGTSPEEYKNSFWNTYSILKKAGMEWCFLIAIGEYNGDKGFDYTPIHQAQLELSEELEDVKLVCDDFCTMRSRGLMKDDFHYYQKAYNEVGKIAGETAGKIVNYAKGGMVHYDTEKKVFDL